MAPDTSTPEAKHAVDEAVSPNPPVGMKCRELQNVAVGEPVAQQLPAATPETPQMLRALRHGDFRLFWGGNFLSNIGTWMQNVAQGWLVLELSNSPFWLGVVGFAASAPMLVFTLIGGVIADQVDRRLLLMRAQAAMMLFAFVLAALTWFKVVNVEEIVLLAFATGTAMSLTAPAYQAMVPQLVPREDLSNAIALNSAQFNLSRVVGPTLGGFAMAWLGVAGNFFLNGLSFLAVLIALSRIRHVPPAADNNARMMDKLSEGFRYVFAHRDMTSLITLVGLVSVLGFPYLIFMPMFARDILHVGETGLGLLMAASGVGAFLAATTLAWRGNVKHGGRRVALAAAVFYATVIAFCFSTNFLLSTLLQMAAGYSMILMVATTNTLLQHLAADEMRGRVMSIYATAFLGFAPIGSLIAGAIAGTVQAQYAIAGMCALGLVCTGFLYGSRRELRRDV